MAASQAPNVGLYHGWTLGEGGWNLQMDANLKAADALLCIGVLSATTTAPPGSPTAGDRYLIPTSATGDWATYDGSIAIWNGTAWDVFPTSNSWNVLAIDTGQTWVKSGGSWVLWATLLGSYANDSAAATGGVPVGGLYINSSSGAMTKRVA
jgi:hypothetical protein